MTTARTPSHVTVVGGGITGLVAALRLDQAGIDVTLIEPGRLGGKLQTSIVAGRPIDESADNFLLRVPWGAALCHDLELDGELTSPSQRTAHVWTDGTRHFLPQGHLLGIPTDLDALAACGLMSPEGLARVAQDLELPADPADPFVAGDDVAIGPYLRRRLGDEIVDHLIDPLVGGINAGDTADLSLAAVVPQLDAAARSGDPSVIRSCQAQKAASTVPAEAPIFATPVGGMARIVDAILGLIPAVDIRQGVAAEGIELVGGEGGAPTGARVALSDGSVVETEAVVVACQAFAAAPLLAGIAPDVAATLAAIDCASVSMATVVLAAADVAAPLDASGCLVPRDQGTLMTAVSYGTSKWAHWRDPERDDVILRASAGRSNDHRHLDLDEADLTEAMLRDLDRVLGLRGAPTEVRVGRWERSLPQYAPGHLDRVAAMEAALDGLPIVLAGAAYRGLGVPACINQGEQAAARLGATWPTRRSLT